MARKYLNTLVKWQQTHRLVGSTNAEWLVENVLLDSFAFLEAVPSGSETLADIGSGAGIPGIPIAIVKPEFVISLIESRRRRVSFLATVIRELSLAHASVIHARAEDLGEEFIDRFDVAVMRCAGQIDAMLPVAMRLVRPGGVVVVAAGPATAASRSCEPESVTVWVGRGARVFHRYTKAGISALTDGA